jgi:transcriptional regulator with XRE-family HTH domain
MTGTELKENRRLAGWTQDRLAARLGVTQAYLSLMERGRRRVPDHVARATTRVLRLPATALPLPASLAFDAVATESWVEQALARLGYPGFAYRKKPGAKRNPMELLLRALASDDLDPRLVEALPWLLLRFEDFDFETLAGLAKVRDLQNRLGFTASLARQVAERNRRWRHRVLELRRLEEFLEPARLAKEDSYGRKETGERMRAWLRDQRSKSAEHWNLLTDLKTEHLPYAGEDPGTLAQLSS